MDARTLLLKFKSDLTTLKDNASSIKGIITDIGSSLTKERDKSKAEAKQAHNEAISLAKQQAQIQLNLIKAKQTASQATTNYEKANAASQIKRLNTQATEIKQQQQILVLKKQIHDLDTSTKQTSGISGLLSKFAGAATGGGGGLLNSLVAGAAGGGMFAIFEKLSEVLGGLVKKFTEIPFAAGELAENLEKSAARAGVSVKEFQQLRLAASAAGVDIHTMSRSLSMMNLQFTKTGGGLSKTEKELSRFGVSIRDASGNLVPTTEIMKRVGDLFQQLPDGMTKARLASDIFTRRIGSQMIPLLNQGGEAIQELYNRAEKYSILVDEDLIKSQHQWNVETTALRMQWEQLEVNLGKDLLPLLVKVAELVNRIAEGWNQLAGVNQVKDFGAGVEDWARAHGMMAGKEQLKFSSAGRSHFDEKVPEDVQRQLAESRYGKSKASRMSFGKNNTWKDLFKDLQAAGAPTNTLIDLFATKFPDALEKTNEGSRKLDKRLQDNSKSLSKVAMATIKYREALAQLAEKQDESKVEGKKFNLKTQFDQGTISQQEYTNRSKDLDKEAYDSKVKYINQWSKLEREKVQQAASDQKKALLGDTEIDAAEMEDKKTNLEKETQEKLLLIGVQTKEKLLDADTKFRKETQTLDLQQVEDNRKANQISLQGDLKVQQERLANDKSFTDYMFKQRLVSVDQYMEDRKKQIDQEVALTLGAAQQEYDNGKKTHEALVQLTNKQIEARMKGEKELTELLRNETQTRVSFSESRYQGGMGYFQGQQAIAQMLPGGSGVKQSNNDLQNQILLTQRYKDEQQDLLSQTRPLTDEWYKILGNMTKATQELLRMNTELLKSKSLMSNTGGIFQQLSNLLSQFGQTRGNLGKIGQAGGVLETIAGGQTKRKASGKTGGVFADMVDAFKDFNFKDMSTSMQKFNEGIKGAVGAVGGFVQILGSSQGKAGDIIGGAVSGGGVGGDIGSLFSSFSKFAGPIGQVAGMAFGGILSGIIGHKNNQVQQFINSVNKQMQSLQTAIQDGSTGIQEGINQLNNLRTSVLQQAGSSKKKQKAALQQEAQTIQDQIIALQQQQAAMFYDLGNQLKVLNSPTQFQGLLGSLKDITDQYKKFAGAARDAKDLAMANQFLADSLRNFADTQATALNEAEQTAIQDAVKLNDLLVQRQQLLTEEAQTEYDIMTQGVLVNQRTVAMTKMQQIQQARNQTNLQLQQIDQDIALTTYKVQSEQQIFHLATTRIGLEAQLLVLQEAQTDKEMLRIKALLQVVTMLNSGTPLSNMDQILAALGLTPPSSTITTPMGLGGGGSLEDLMNEIRNNRARGGFGSAAGYLYS